MTDEKRSGKDLVEHWTRAADEGLMSRTSAIHMAVSCQRVLEVRQGWENVDVLTLDEDELSIQFKNIRESYYKPSTLRDYAGRFRRGVRSYREFLVDPDKWRDEARAKMMGTARPESRQSEGGDTVRNAEERKVRLQEYVYPFRQNVLATLKIPQDATAAEIRRLVAWAQTLAVDYEGG